MSRLFEFPAEIWQKIVDNLSDHPPSLCLLSQLSCQFDQSVNQFVRRYEAHLHVTFPDVEQQNTSSENVVFEMILNRKGKFRNGKSHCHSTFTCHPSKINEAFDDILGTFAHELISLRFNGFPSDTTCFTVFSKFTLPKCDNLCFNGSLPIHNGVYDMIKSCPDLHRLTISNPDSEADFSKFWPLLKGSKLQNLDLLNVAHFHHSSIREFKLPKSMTQLFVSPKNDTIGENQENLATLLYSAPWERVYIHSEKILKEILPKLYKPLKNIEEFSFSSSEFSINFVIQFLKKCSQIKALNWYGLHSCVAPIVIAKLLNEIKRKIIFGGCVPCKSGQSVGNAGFMEVGNRVNAVQITRLLEKPEFRNRYGSILDDAVLFENHANSSTVMYILRKDSHCGPNCIDIHEISENAGISLK